MTEYRDNATDAPALAGPVSAPSCLALIMLAAIHDLSRTARWTFDVTASIQLVVLCVLLVALVLAIAARSGLAAPGATDRLRPLAVGCARAAFILATLSAATLWMSAGT